MGRNGARVYAVNSIGFQLRAGSAFISILEYGHRVNLTLEDAMLYELRIYHAMPGRMPDLNRRFETITLKIWERFGIRQVGFWNVQIGESNQDLYYMLEWKDLAERERIWSAFMADPEWQKARAETEKNGPLLQSISNYMLTPTVYSKMK